MWVSSQYRPPSLSIGNHEPLCHYQVNIEITLFAAWMLLLHYYSAMVSNFVIYYDNIFGDWICFMGIQVINVPKIMRPLSPLRL